MIKDNIQNAEKYFNLSERVKLGLKYLQNTDLAALEDGRYEILGNQVYVNIQNYLSKEEADAKFEAHKNYIDIQYIIDGEERIWVSDVDNFTPLSQYDSEKDIVFLKRNTSGEENFVNLRSNEFLILNPQDAHMPSLAVNCPSKVKKAVVKVLV